MDNSLDNNLLFDPVINILVLSVDALKELITSSNFSTFWISSKKI